jgi:hypothetical protein
MIGQTFSGDGKADDAAAGERLYQLGGRRLEPLPDSRDEPGFAAGIPKRAALLNRRDVDDLINRPFE